MAKKLENFRNLNQSNKKTPTEKVGVISEKRMKKEDVKTRKKNKSTTSKIMIFFLILVIIGVGIGILFSPAFNLTEVVVVDGVNVNSAEILNQVNVTYGENILKQNYKLIKEGVLAIPYVKEANIKLIAPGKIEIKYVEREPYMLIKYLESFFVVDKYGYLLEIKKENDLENLPIIYGIDIDSNKLGEMLSDISGTKYKKVVTLIETAKQRNFPHSIFEINYESISQVKLWVKDYDIDIIYGEIDKNLITDKLNYLEGVLKKLKGKSGELDISSEKYLEKTIFTERY